MEKLAKEWLERNGQTDPWIVRSVTNFADWLKGRVPMPGAAEFRALLNDADGALDKDTYEQIQREKLDLPDDAEIYIRVGTQRKINRLFAALDHQLKSDT